MSAWPDLDLDLGDDDPCRDAATDAHRRAAHARLVEAYPQQLPPGMGPQVWLTDGTHDTRADGCDVCELAAWLAGEPHSDVPRSVCRYLGAVSRLLNDVLGTRSRQRLTTLAATLAGTADGRADLRARMNASWCLDLLRRPLPRGVGYPLAAAPARTRSMLGEVQPPGAEQIAFELRRFLIAEPGERWCDRPGLDPLDRVAALCVRVAFAACVDRRDGLSITIDHLVWLARLPATAAGPACRPARPEPGRGPGVTA